MNGWIKMEKDLLTDPRLLRLARMLTDIYEYIEVPDPNPEVLFTARNGEPLPGVTVVLGALAHLWMIADTHIRDDDVLPLGIDEINQIIGMQGFCEILPPNWLQVIDSHNVKLPGYQEHNGPAAKQRALGARRVAIHRTHRNGQPLHPGNGDALPDKDKDLDKDTKKKKAAPKKIGARLPEDWNLTPERIAVAQQHGLDAARVCEYFRNYWHAKAGRDACKLDWDLTWRNWCATEAQRKPSVTVNGATPDHSAEWAEAKARAAAIGFRAPWPQESAAAYMTQVKLTESRTSGYVLKRIEAQRT